MILIHFNLNKETYKDKRTTSALSQCFRDCVCISAHPSLEFYSNDTVSLLLPPGAVSPHPKP